MSKAGEEDLMPGKAQGVQRRTKDEKAQNCEIGHKDRQELEALLRETRILVTLKD